MRASGLRRTAARLQPHGESRRHDGSGMQPLFYARLLLTCEICELFGSLVQNSIEGHGTMLPINFELMLSIAFCSQVACFSVVRFLGPSCGRMGTEYRRSFIESAPQDRCIIQVNVQGEASCVVVAAFRYDWSRLSNARLSPGTWLAAFVRADTLHSG